MNKKGVVLDELMLAMDVVDTLRYRDEFVRRELGGEEKEAQLISKLRKIYQEQGIEVPDRILKEGVKALSESRFVYEPPPKSFKTALARLYVSRSKWGPWLIGIILAIIIAFSYWQFIYLPKQERNIKNAQIELLEIMPKKMDELYQTIIDEAKVQEAISMAEEIVKRGKIAIREENRQAAQEAINELTKLRDKLRLEYDLRIVNREGEKSGFWTFPEINNAATNYYLVVEAIDKKGNKLSLPILNEENGEIKIVNIWGVRVPEEVYAQVASDKRDDGIIQKNIIGNKPYGYLEVNYSISVLGGAITEW